MTATHPLVATPTVTVETITPTVAKRYLERNDGNRNVKDDHEMALADDMRRGEWHLTGDSIKFDTNGNLLDGQHRLRACVRSNQPFTTVVTRGLDRSTVLPAIDTGKSRTPGDILALLGYQDPLGLASAARTLNWIRHSQPTNSASYARRCKDDIDTRSALIAFVKSNEDMLIAGLARGTSVPNRMLPRAVVAALWTEFALVDTPLAATEFWSSMATGAGLSESDPRLMLRNRLMEDAIDASGRSTPTRKVVRTRADRVRIVVRTWNAWVTNHGMNRLPLGKGTSSINNIPVILAHDATEDAYRRSSSFQGGE